MTGALAQAAAWLRNPRGRRRSAFVAAQPTPGTQDALGADSGHNRAEYDAIARSVGRASGFSLSFVVVNHPSLRDDFAASLARDRDALVVRLRPGMGGSVAQLTGAAAGGAGAGPVVVTHLEDLVDDGPSSALDELNLNRDFLANSVERPLVIVGPSWLLRRVAHDAVDLWSVRSHVFELLGDATTGRESVKQARSALDWNTPPGERDRAGRLLDDLVAEDEEVGSDDPRYAVELLTARADTALMQGRSDDAADLLGQALPLYRAIGDRRGEANALLLLARTRRHMGQPETARRNYREAERLYRPIAPAWAELAAQEGAALGSDESAVNP